MQARAETFREMRAYWHANPNDPYATALNNLAYVAQQGLDMKNGTTAQKKYFYDTWAPYWQAQLKNATTHGEILFNGKADPLAPGLTPAELRALGKRLTYAVGSVFAHVAPVFGSNG